MLYSLNELAKTQQSLESDQDTFSTAARAEEQRRIDVYSADGTTTRKQIYSFAVQELIVHAVQVAQYPTLEKLAAATAEEQAEYQQAVAYIYYNGRNMIDLSEENALFIYEDSVSSRTSDKTVLIGITAAAMGAALLCYVLIIPRVLSVVRHKADVMQIFADISNKNIQEMVKGISQISINSVVFDSRQVDGDAYQMQQLPGVIAENSNTSAPAEISKHQSKDEHVVKVADEPVTQNMTTSNNLEAERNQTRENDQEQAKVNRKRESLKQSE
ncbi:MAG: hypothetical protein P4M11_04805 [Candidatus Pacebacteria bacterium]|nr:hypothetical protein [Candidatus Paceibacterota bacterium]